MRAALALLAAAAVPVLVSAGSPAPRDTALAPECGLATADRHATRSGRCLACHDGAGASAVAVALGPWDRHGGHPVEVDYEGARARGERLRPSAQLPAALPLVAGRVACTTCHAAASAEAGHAALPLGGSALCLACHAL